MKKTFFLLLAVAGLSAALTSCTKDPLNNLTPQESQIYITNHDSTTNFSSFKTFSVSDSVAVLNNGQETKELSATDLAYITAVKNYMQQRGYTMVDKSQKPDLGINVNRIYNTTTGVISYDDYWSDYGGYWDPYYWGYPDYGYYLPYDYSIYQIREGAVSIDMLDLKDAASTNKINVVWTGLILGEGIFDATTADSRVQALFNQSPYIKTAQ
ncbi:MAG: DUF4136 domain-containing protein [Chitinophagaceae bacterium]